MGMSRKSQSRRRGLALNGDFTLRASRGLLRTSVVFTLSASALTFGVFTACGGTQGAAPATSTEEAGVDATLGQQLDPSFADPCQAAQAFTYQPLLSFDNAPGGNPADLGQTYAPYVSYDLTGTLFQCNSTCANSVPPVETQVAADPVMCMTGYQPSTTQCEQMPVAHCSTMPNYGIYGLHLRADGLTAWGMNVGIDLRQNCNGVTTAAAPTNRTPCFFDATGWTGISFWARLGFGDDPDAAPPTGQRATTLLVTVADPSTATELGGNAGVPIGPYPFNGPSDGGPPVCGQYPCQVGNPSANLDAGVLPCDPFGEGILLPQSTDGGSNPWQFYAIPFSDLRQKGYGIPEPGLDLTHILGVTINLSKGQLGTGDYDVWIDDVAFYK